MREAGQGQRTGGGPARRCAGRSMGDIVSITRIRHSLVRGLEIVYNEKNHYEKRGHPVERNLFGQ